MSVIIYNPLVDIGGLFVGISFFIFFMVLVHLIIKVTSSRKSQDYRKLLCDLYIVGEIKKLSNESKIDLDIEYKEFLKWTKKIRREERNSRRDIDLDNVIEEELKEQISESSQEKLEKK